MKKKLISIVLAVILLLGVMTPAAMAAGFDIETIVAPKYQEVGGFSDGLAAVKQNGKWGYIDENGKTVIKAQFDFANSFSEGIAVVGFINEENSDPEYGEYCYELSLVDESGKVTDLYYDLYGDEMRMAFYDGTWQSIDAESVNWFCQNGIVNVCGYTYTAD